MSHVNYIEHVQIKSLIFCKVEFEGEVIEALPNAMFRVRARQRPRRARTRRGKDAALPHPDPARRPRALRALAVRSRPRADRLPPPLRDPGLRTGGALIEAIAAGAATARRSGRALDRGRRGGGRGRWRTGGRALPTRRRLTSTSASTWTYRRLTPAIARSGSCAVGSRGDGRSAPARPTSRSVSGVTFDAEDGAPADARRRRRSRRLTGVTIAGGDVVRSPVVLRCRHGRRLERRARVVGRDGALVGRPRRRDGDARRAAAGVEVLAGRLERGPHAPALIARHARPLPRLEEGRALAGPGSTR